MCELLEQTLPDADPSVVLYIALVLEPVWYFILLVTSTIPIRGLGHKIISLGTFGGFGLIHLVLML